MMAALPLAAFPLAMVLAVLSDIRTMTISNALTMGLAALFPVAAFAAGLGPATIGLHLLVGLAALAVTIAFFAAGWMGGGDAKLIAAAALWLGPSVDLFHFLVLSALFGGALTILILVARAFFKPATGNASLDRILTPWSGIPYGIALGLAGILVFAQGWMGEALAGAF